MTDGHVHPTRDDVVVTPLSEGVGGPMGQHGKGNWLTPASIVLLLTGLCFAVGMVQKSSCYDATWGDGQARYSHMCYSDLPYLYTGRGMVEHTWPYTDDEQVRSRFDVMEYPVGISYWAWGIGLGHAPADRHPDLSDRSDRDPGSLWGEADVQREIRLFVVVNAIGFAVLALAAAWLLTKVNPRRPWDAAVFALSPTARADRAHQLGPAGGGASWPRRCGPGPPGDRC